MSSHLYFLTAFVVCQYLPVSRKPYQVPFSQIHIDIEVVSEKKILVGDMY